MPIPKTRCELVDLVTTRWTRLHAELDAAGPSVAKLPCVDGWTVKDLLAVRAWWTESVIDWVEAGRRGETPVTPAPGYRWKETPRLNERIVKAAKKQSYRTIRARLERGCERVMATIDSLNDKELLEAGTFGWAGKYPLVRWISINTARQYETARTLHSPRAAKPNNIESSSATSDVTRVPTVAEIKAAMAVLLDRLTRGFFP